MTLDSITDRYTCASIGELVLIRVSSPAVLAAARVAASMPSKPETEGAPRLSEAIQIFKRALWRVHTSLVVLSDESLRLESDAEWLESHAPIINRQVGSRRGSLVNSAAAALRTIAESPANPLLAAVIVSMNEISDRSSAALCVIGRHQTMATEGLLRCEGVEAAVVERADLRTGPSFEDLVVVGSPRWFPDSIATAPVALSTAFVCYEWTAEPRTIRGLLPTESNGVERPLSTPTGSSPMEFDSTLDNLDLVPVTDWAAISCRGRTGPAEHGIMAKTYLLGGGHAAFFPSSDDTDILTGIREGPTMNIKRRTASAVGVGEYVVLRMEHSDSDYVRELADVRFGAAQYRPLLEEWKSELRRRLLAMRVADVEDALRRRGAQSFNIRYWASETSISVRSGADFEIMLDWLGLGGRTDELRAASEQVLRAHIHAGVRLRQMLEDKLTDSDLHSLHRKGWVEVQLEKDAGGSLGVFEVLAVSPTASLVDGDILRRPIELQEHEWHA